MCNSMGGLDVCLMVTGWMEKKASKKKKWFFVTEETFFHICEQDQKTKSNGNTTTKHITY